MKKNGFTLIELIGTLVLMSLISTVILINMVGMKDEQDSSSASGFKKQVEEAACTYIDSKEQMALRASCKSSSSGCNVTLETLINEGLIESSLIDKKTNKTAEEEKSTIKVWIHFDGNPKQKKCEMQR